MGVAAGACDAEIGCATKFNRPGAEPSWAHVEGISKVASSTVPGMVQLIRSNIVPLPGSMNGDRETTNGDGAPPPQIAGRNSIHSH